MLTSDLTIRETKLDSRRYGFHNSCYEFSRHPVTQRTNIRSCAGNNVPDEIGTIFREAGNASCENGAPYRRCAGRVRRHCRYSAQSLQPRVAASMFQVETDGQGFMAWTIDAALADQHITVTERSDGWGQYSFTLGELDTEITEWLCRSPLSEETRYPITHAIKTPDQGDPHIQSRVWWDYPAYALHQAISTLTFHYEGAVKNNRKPSESWLKLRSPAF